MGDNVTASDDSETVGGYETKNGQVWNKLPSLVSCCRKHNTVTGKPGLTAYSDNISSLGESLKLITNYIH
jgi:hypothetical protein